ncbi:MAG: GTPase HflX [bacterium]|nr:GTPase HflX [bacterium]
MATTPKLRCVLLQVINPHRSHTDPEIAAKNLKELEQLVMTLGGEVIEKAAQHRFQPHPSTYIGGGKVEWLKEVVAHQDIDVVILNNVAKSSQIFRLEQMLWEFNPRIKVWDRVDLILNIFELHARTTEAKLQIELARIQHLGPRIYGLGGTVLSRQSAGVGTRGLGESNSEIERRKIKRIKQQIQKELAELSQVQLRQIHKRKDQQTATVALVGYTSSGKTTLFNALTGKDRETNSSLFTTLDSVVGKLKMEEHQSSLLISDTIGFIDDLPPQLIEAFRTSLLVSLEAQILLHVIDAADQFMESKFEVVESILQELGVTELPVLVFNKADRLSPADRKKLSEKFSDRKHLFISAKTGENLDELKKSIR